jgi:hypothetical protein
VKGERKVRTSEGVVKEQWDCAKAERHTRRKAGRQACCQAGRVGRRTGRQADGQAEVRRRGGQADRQAGVRQAGWRAGRRQTKGQAGKREDRRAGKQEGWQAGGHAGRRARMRAGRQAVGQTGGRALGRQVDRQEGKQTESRQTMPGSMQQRCTANMTLMGRVLVSATNRAKRGTWRQIASHICNGHTHRTST